MSGDKYIISDQHAPYFITCTVIHWIDLFTRKVYRDIIVDSLNYCIKEKNLVIYAWVVMSNHLHLVAQVKGAGTMSGFLRDFKKFTSKEFVRAMDHINESREEWLKDKFSFEARKTGRAENYKVWRDDNHAIDLTNLNMMDKIDYIHMNPVRAGLVENPECYIYSSAWDYSTGKKGLVDVEVV